MGKLLYLPGDQKQPSGNQLVTLDDLEKFRINLLMDIRKMLEGQLAKPPKRWIKSYSFVRVTLRFLNSLPALQKPPERYDNSP